MHNLVLQTDNGASSAITEVGEALQFALTARVVAQLAPEEGQQNAAEQESWLRVRLHRR